MYGRILISVSLLTIEMFANGTQSNNIFLELGLRFL